MVIEPRYLGFRYVVAVIAIGLLLLAFAPLDRPAASKTLNYVTIGYVFGTFFGTATLAAAWSALGPLTFGARLVLSLVWMSAVLVAFATNLAGDLSPPDAMFLVFFGGCLFGQWAVALVPSWAFAIAFSLRLEHVSVPAVGLRRGERQFGIRQLLSVITIVAIVMGIGRLIVIRFAESEEFRRGVPNQTLLLFLFLAVVGIVMVLPLVLSALLPRGAVLASILVLALIGMGTVVELQLLALVNRGNLGPEAGDICAINGFQVAWVLAVIGALRLGGYRLTTVVRNGQRMT